MARKLAERNIPSLVLESGGLEYTPDAQNLFHGYDSGLPYFSLVGTRLRFFGGATNHWGANCFPFTQTGVAARPWVGLPAWPIPYEELNTYYRQAIALLELPQETWNAGYWAQQTDSKLPDFQQGLIEPYIVQIGKPNARRFNRRFVDEFRASKQIKTLIHANVVDFVTSKDRSTVDRVVVKTLKGNQFTVAAKYFVLATGGIENARLMLNCKSDTDRGLGNENGLVGRYFMDHPRFSAGRILPAAGFRLGKLSGISTGGGRRYQVQYRISEKAQKQRGLMQSSIMIGDTINPKYRGLNDAVGVRKSRAFWRNLKAGRTDLISSTDMLSLWENFDDLAKLGYATARYGDEYPINYLHCVIRLEPHPNIKSRITLSDKKDPLGIPRVNMDWALDEVDRKTAQQTMHVLAEEVTKSGLGRVQSYIDEPDWIWPEATEGGHHQVGTTRMDDNPKFGVVDRHGKLHTKQNFYIAGSSIFPTADMGWPTLTIIALAHRQAAHIESLLNS